MPSVINTVNIRMTIVLKFLVILEEHKVLEVCSPEGVVIGHNNPDDETDWDLKFVYREFSFAATLLEDEMDANSIEVYVLGKKIGFLDMYQHIDELLEECWEDEFSKT